MREAIRDKSRLEHILQAIDIILKNKDRFTLDTVSGDPITYYGFVKHIEIVGEAVYMLTREFKEAHPEVEWEVIEGMRHVLVHGYYRIKPVQVWDTIQHDLPALRSRIQKLYDSFD